MAQYTLFICNKLWHRSIKLRLVLCNLLYSALLCNVILQQHL